MGGGGGGGLVARRELIASGRDDCFSRGYADAYIYGRAQTSTSINRRDVHSHARERARVFANDYLARADVSIFR